MKHTGTVEYLPWDDVMKRHLIACAKNVSVHDDTPHTTKLEQDNCSACALRKFTKTSPPNYAGWPRIYLALGWPVPRVHYRNSFPYWEALRRDEATFGITYLPDDDVGMRRWTVRDKDGVVASNVRARNAAEALRALTYAEKSWYAIEETEH